MLHSLILGQGKPFVILHGFLGMADNWKTLGTQWSEMGYELHLLDQRNHGRSIHSEAFSYELMAQDLMEYCEHHNLNDIILLGHSMGGKVAMQFASAYPEMLEKLIIADIAPKEYAPHHSDIINALQAVNFESITNRNEVDEILSSRIPDMGTRLFLMKSLFRKDKNKFAWRFNLNALASAQAMIGSHTPFDNIIQVPTLFIKGGNSGYILETDRMIIDAAFAKATIITIPDAGHWLHAEQPELFSNAVLDFIR
jgi:pimeloyl-ACP methyl ester carboxylesterase